MNLVARCNVAIALSVQKFDEAFSHFIFFDFKHPLFSNISAVLRGGQDDAEASASVTVGLGADGAMEPIPIAKTYEHSQLAIDVPTGKPDQETDRRGG